MGHLLVFDSRRPFNPFKGQKWHVLWWGGGGSWLQDTQAHCKGAVCFSFPHLLGPGPLLPVATSKEHTIACYEEGPADAGLPSPGRIVHLRANDVEKQQVHGHSRAGLSSSAVPWKPPPTPAPGPPCGGQGGAHSDSSLSLCPGEVHGSSSNFGEFSPNHSRDIPDMLQLPQLLGPITFLAPRLTHSSAPRKPLWSESQNSTGQWGRPAQRPHGFHTGSPEPSRSAGYSGPPVGSPCHPHFTKEKVPSLRRPAAHPRSAPWGNKSDTNC